MLGNVGKLCFAVPYAEKPLGDLHPNLTPWPFGIEIGEYYTVMTLEGFETRWTSV